MRLMKCHLQNFASYKSLDFDFSSLGLTLIYGATGSGKSTLFDAAAWIMFGVTAKNGSVDDVRGWYNLEEPTQGSLEIQLSEQTILITRIRGKPSQNDLYWSTTNEEFNRGKDISDTQKMLNALLGVDADLYLSAAYFCEFSPTGTFFLDKSKNQRELFEKIAPLEFAVTIAERASDERKEAKRSLAERQTELTRSVSRLCQNRDTADALARDDKAWEDRQVKQVEDLKNKSKNFESEKTSKVVTLQSKVDAFKADTLKSIAGWNLRLEQIELELASLEKEKCETCGRSDSDSKKQALTYELKEGKKAKAQLETRYNPYLEQLESTKTFENLYEEQIVELNTKKSPFLSQINTHICDIAALELKIEGLEAQVLEIEQNITALNQLYDLSFDLRGELLRKSVKEIESETNRYLETYFDSAMRVSFLIGSSDSLEVTLQKDSHECVYRQLSKGQRGLLKLAFALSVMKAAANKAGIHFSNLYFDEALDGLDSDLKVKAFSLFQEIEKDHETVLLIDHSTEFKSLFTKQYCVSLNSDNSGIQLDDE